MKSIRHAVVMVAASGLMSVAGGADAESRFIPRQFETRPSISVRAIVATPEKPVGQVILLPGGGGEMGLNDAGRVTSAKMADNFIVRTRARYVDAGFRVIVPDTAPDVVNLAANREASAKHREDVIAMAAALKKESALPIWLVGTSASSWRLAAMTPRLQDEVGIAGIVLTASVVAIPEVLLPAAAKVTVPVLLVHHRQDACYYSKPESLQSLVDALKTTSKKLVWIEGGNSQGDPCHEWAYHGFNGKEDEVLGIILGWLRASR